jgi:hypothetical protein
MAVARFLRQKQTYAGYPGIRLLPHHCRNGERWTKLPMISTWDDIYWIWSKRASSTSIVASLDRLAVVPFHLVQHLGRNVACLATVICVPECRLRG